MWKILKCSVLFFLVLVLALSGCSSKNASSKNGEDYPKKTIQLIVPWSAGGDTDAIFRLISKGLEKELGQTVVVKNIEGGGGTIGAAKAVKADPDGYTLLAVHDSIAMSKLTGKADFGYFDFAPVALMTSTHDAVATSIDSPWNTMKDVIKDAKKNPGKITFAASIGSTSELEPAEIQTAADITFNIVGYEGTAKRMQAVIGNHVDLGSVSVVAGKDYLKAHKMKLLGFIADERNPAIPDVPTLKEQGINVVSGTNRGVFAPKGTPKPIIEKLSKALEKVANSKEFKDKMTSLGTEINYKDQKEYTQFLKDNQKEMTKALKKSGLLKK